MSGWRLLAVAIAGTWAWGSACGLEELQSCTKDADCKAGAVCRYELCVTEPAPEVLLSVDRTEARMGEDVIVDASASAAPRGEKLTFAFAVEPEDAATIAVEADGVRAVVQRRLPHVDATIVVTARTPRGRTGEARVQIAAKNSDPRVSLSTEPATFQPGGTVTLIAPASDADDDVLLWEWSLEGTNGSLKAQGDRAVLTTVGGLADVGYPVTVRVLDTKGGVATASVTLRPQNEIPPVVLEPASVDHGCSGSPIVCSAVFELRPTTTDPGDVTWKFELVDERPEVSHGFRQRPDGTTELTLTCSPACKLAGTWRVAVTAVDDAGGRNTVQVPLEVRNRPPVVRAHDGSAVPHAAVLRDGTWSYVIARPFGAVVTWEDPDGDPPVQRSIKWSSTSDIVEFVQPDSLETVVQALGSRDEIAAIEIALQASDINGALVADRAVLPVGNTPPTVTFGGDASPGHSFVRTESDGTRVYRKEISLATLQSADADGDPLLVQVELDPLDRAAEGVVLRLIEQDGKFFLEGEGPTFLEKTYRIITRVVDPWGGTAVTTGGVLVSNRPPVIVNTPQPSTVIRGARQCQVQSCCVPVLGGSGCAANPSARIASTWGFVSGPLVVAGTVEIRDPDGDPPSLEVGFAATDLAFPRFRVGNGWSTTTGSIACTPQGSTWSCPVEVRIEGLAVAPPFSCALTQGTNVGAFVELLARANDGLGGVSAEETWSYEAADDPADGSCP